MAEVQLPSGLWVSSAFEGKSDRAQQASVVPNLTGDQVPSKFRTYSEFLEAIRIDWVYACVSLIAYSFAANRWDLIDADEDPLEAPTDPFLQLMERPNPVQSGFTFLELLAMYLELTGNAYITLESRDGMGRPRELYLPNPARMRIIPDPTDYIRGYVFDATGLSGGGGRRLIPYEPDEVVHIKWSNPIDDYYGMGNIEPSSDLLDIVQSMMRQEKGYWSSGGRIVGTLQTDQTLTTDEFDQLVATWARANRDEKQRARIAVLQKGVKFQPIAEGLRGLDLVNIEKGKRDRILAVFGVPLPKLGIMEQSQYKQEDADRTFHGETMTPKFRRFEDGVQPLVDLFHPDRRWRFERRNFEDDTSKLNNANVMGMSGLFTVDEARVYFGADPLPNGNGNVLYVSSGFTAVPLDSLGELAEDTLAPSEPPGGVLPAEPSPEPEKPPMVPGNAPAVVDAALGAAEDAGVDLPAGKALTDVEVKQLAVDARRAERLARAVAHVQRKAPRTPIERLRSCSVKAAPANGRRRPVAHPAIAAAAERGMHKARAEALRAYVPKIREAFRAQQKKLTQPKTLQAILRASDPAEALRAVWDTAPLREAIAAVHTFAAQRGRAVASSLLPLGTKDDQQGWADLDFGDRITGIDDTTREAVAEQIREGLRRGYSPLQIAEGYDAEGYDGIAGVFSAATDWRAEMIARDATRDAYNAAANDRYREAGLDKVQLLDGTAFDAECAERDGTVVGIDDVPEDHPNGTLTTAPWFDDSTSSDETPDE